MEYKLNDEISLKYIESIKIDAKNYYKYDVINLKNKSVSRSLYFDKEINLEEIDKDKLSGYITEKILSSSDENIFIDLDEFMLENNNAAFGGENVKSKSSGKGNINLLNYEDFDKAIGLIRGAKECDLSSLSNLNNLDELGGENKNIDTGIFDISTKINQLGKGDGPAALVDNYISAYDEILAGIIETYAADQKTKAETGKLNLNQSTLDIEGAEDAIVNGIINYTTGILDGNVKPTTLGEYFKEINTIYNNYSTSSIRDYEDVLNAANLTEDSDALKDMSEEDRKKYIEEKNKQLDGMYDSIKDSLNISRDEFDRLLQNDTGKLAEMLSAQSETDVKNRLSGVGDISGVNDFYYEIENLWYSTEAGQEALFEKFKIDSPTKYDEEDALAYTEYIKYCMSREHSQDWLREDLRKFANVVSKIDANDTFSKLSDDKITQEELEYITSFMTASGGYLPYGYEKVGDTYKRREYTKQGEDMLYYMDYHCGEDVRKEGEEQVITAFSNQGRLDAYQRNYKGAWINSQLTGNYASEAERQEAITNAERDYNILNGIIEDETRKQQLIDEGEISFEQLVNFINNNNIDLERLSDEEYIKANKEAILKETGLSEAQLYNFAVSGNIPKTGDAKIDATMQGTVTLFSSLGITGLQALSGVGKYFENVGDAAKTAVKSDFILNLGIDFDDMGNLYLDLSKNIELTKEFKEYRDSVWEKYLKSELYKEQYEKFKDSASIDKAVKDYYEKYLYDPATGQYRGLDGKTYYSYEDIPAAEKLGTKQKLLPSLFKESKFKEWNLNDSSSSNYYLATFKEGIRNGGDFSSFDDLDSTVVRNAIEQFDTINKVSVDETGKWWDENVYSKDWYNTVESFSIVKKDNILGMAANQIGNMAIPVGLSALGASLGMPNVGQVLSSTALFTSAFGGATEEAFVSGASYNEALGYATLSATTELAIEKVFSGIAGFGEGWMDDVIDFIPNKVIDAVGLKDSVITQSIKSLITGGIGEGIEEVTTDLVTPLWQSLTYMNDKSYADIVSENVSFESLKQTFLVSFLTSMVFGSSEINQKTNAFNKQMKTLTNEIGDIPGFKEQSNKVLADIIGYDGQYLTSDIITKIIENNAKQIELNPEGETALKELQQKLIEAYQNLTKNSVELKTEDGSVKLSKKLIMNITDIARLNQKNIFNRKDGVVIEEDKISFKDPKTQQKFINTLYENAKNVIGNQIIQNNKLILILQEALQLAKKDILKIEDINSAIQTLKEFGDKSHFSETLGSATLEIGGKEITIPTSVVHEITAKYNVKDGKILFTEENMNAKEFVSKILSKAIVKLKLKNAISMKEIQSFNEAAKKGSIKLLEKAASVIGNNLDTFVVNSTKVDGKDLVKLEVKTNVNGEYRNVSIYVDSSTNPTVYLHNDLLTEKIQEIIDENVGKDNIYLGEITYDKKNDELIIKENQENRSYVENIKTSLSEENLTIHSYEVVDGTNKTYVNIYIDAQTDPSILDNNNVKNKVNEIVTEKIKTNPGVKDIYIGKVELKDGQPKITTDRNQKAYVDSKTENIVTTNRTNISGTNLTKVESYVTIDGKTEKVNAYIDSKSNTSLLSKKSAKQKILEMIIEEKTKNKDAKDVYVGEIINDKKSGNIVAKQNEATLEQFKAVIIASIISNETTKTSTPSKITTGNVTKETADKTENKNAVVEEIIIDTKNIFNEKNAKVELDKFIQTIEKNIKDFVSKYKKTPDFVTRFEQLKSDVNIKFNEKIIEVTNKINESYNSVIETINKKIESLNENDTQIEKLKSEIDTLTKAREEAIKKLKEYDISKIDEIFNSVSTSSGVKDNNNLKNIPLQATNTDSSTEVQKHITVERFDQASQTFEEITRDNTTHIDNSNQTKVTNATVEEIINKDEDVGIKAEENKNDSATQIEEDDEAIVEQSTVLHESYLDISTKILLEFMELSIEDIAKVIIDGNKYEGYDASSILDSIIELYNHAKENNLDLNINPNLEYFIKEYQSFNLDERNQLFNLENALYKGESIIYLPISIKGSSYISVSVNDLFDILNGIKDISTTNYSQIDIFEATKELAKYFEVKDISTSELTKIAFDIVNGVDENSVIINFMDGLHGKEKIILPKEIQGEYGKDNISDVLKYLNGKSAFIRTGVIKNLKEYIDTHDVHLSSEIMDKINLLTSLGKDNVLLNEKAYLKGESSPIIVPKNLEGIYTSTSNIYDWITGKEKLYNIRTIEEVIKITIKFTEYIYSNNIILDNITMSKLEVLKNLKENETILNLQEFFNGETAIIIGNNISMNGNNFKVSTILDIINLNASTYLEVLSGENIDGITRENIFDAIEVLYYTNPSLKEATQENYEKIKSIYSNNFVLNGRYVLPNEFNNVSTQFIENILNHPTMIKELNPDEIEIIYKAIDEYINYIGENHGKYFTYDERVKMKNNLIDLASRQIKNLDLTEDVYSPLYSLFQTISENGGTFGTNQGVIREMLKEVGIKDMIKALFQKETITDDNFLSDLQKLNITKEKLTQAIDDLFMRDNNESAAKLINFINNNEVIKLVQKNFPGMNGIEAIRFLYLVEGYEGSLGICNYAAAVNMIFNKYIGKEVEFERTFGYPMYIINSQGKKVLNDSMLLVDMYSTINKDILVKEVNGRYEIATTNDIYLNLSDIGRFNMEYLQKFIDAKGIDLGLNETFYYTSLENAMWKEELILKVKEALEKGEYINVSGAGFDLLYPNGEIATTEVGGHIMTVVGLTKDGKLIVDSWGKELYINLEATMNSLGDKVEIDGNKITRRLAIASYEFTDQSNGLNQKSETIDIPKEIDMIDESVNNMNSKDAENNTIPSSFEVTGINILTREDITINIDTKLLEELTQDSSKLESKLTGLFNFNLPPTAIKDGVIKYIDFAKENNIPIIIDKNVQKWYEAVKNAKENNMILTNENDVIARGLEPKTRLIYEFDSVKYNKYFGEIKITDLIDMLDGKTNIILTPTEFTTALNELSKYIKEEGIKLNENTTKRLNQITNINQSQVVVNPIEVIKGNNPIILNRYIKVDGQNVSTLKIVELISNNYNLVGYIKNNFYVDELQHIDMERAVIALFNESTELAIQYNKVLDLIKEAINNYVLFDYINKKYIILPKEINGVNIEELLQFRTLSKGELNRKINTLDTEVLNKYKSTIDSIISIVNEKGLQVDVLDLVKIKSQLEVPNETHRNVFGILHKAYSLNKEIGGTYGPEQSAIGIKLSKIQFKSSIETLFKTKMTDIEFFKHLGLDSITQEKFEKIFNKNYKKQNGIFAKMFGNYANTEGVYQELQKLTEIVKNNIPGLDNKQAFMFLYYIQAGEIGKNGICSYADAASIIINKYLEDPIRFEQDFGFPMYTVNSKGDRIYNYEMLIVDMYSSINKYTLLAADGKTGNVVFNPTNDNQVYLSDFDIGINVEVLNKYFKDKNISLSLNKTLYFNSQNDAMHYEKILEIICNELKKGNTVHLGASGFALLDEQNYAIADNIGEHTMTVLGVNSDGNLVVNSWGNMLIFDLKSELAKTGNKYYKKDKNGNIIKEGTSVLDIQVIETKDSAFDGPIELTRNSNRDTAKTNINLKGIASNNKQYNKNNVKEQFKDLTQYIKNDRSKQLYNDLVFKNKVKEIYENLVTNRLDSLKALYKFLSKYIGKENASNLMYEIGKELLPNENERNKVSLSNVSINKESISQYFKDMFKYLKNNKYIGNSQYNKALHQVDKFLLDLEAFEKTISRLSIESDLKLNDLQLEQLNHSMTRILMYMQILNPNIDIGKIRIIVRNSESPARFNERYNSGYSITKSETGYDIELWNSNISEENVVRAFANIIVLKISSTENSNFASRWVKAIENKANNKISSNNNLISIAHDFIESFVAFNKNPKQYLESFSGKETKGTIIKDLFIKSKDENISSFVNAILKQSGENILLYPQPKIDLLTQFRYEANNNGVLSQEVFNNYSYEDYHLIFGGIALNKDGLIYGAHSVSNFVKSIISNNIQISNFVVHPSFRKAVFEYSMMDKKGGYSPKTLFAYEHTKLLKMYHYTIAKYRQAINNNILTNIGDKQLILLPNGLWVQRYGDINSQSTSYHPIINDVAGGVRQFVHENKTNLPIPIKVNGDIKIINVSIDGEISKEILEYGPKLIQTIRRTINNNQNINSIDISKLRFNTLTETFDIVIEKDGIEMVIPNSLVMNKETGPYVLEYIEAFKSGKVSFKENIIIKESNIVKFRDSNKTNLSNQELEIFDTPKEIDMIDESTYDLERDESIEDLEPLIIDDKQFNGSNESSQNVQIKTSRPQIQIENIKQLSILDNMKYTLQRINDKFTGFKTSKLNSESYYDRTTKSNNKLFKQKRINKTFRDFANRHLIDLENLISNGLLRNPKISEINSLITNNRVLQTMEDANVSIADILGTKKNIDLDKNFNSLFNEGSSEFQTRDLGLLEYTSDQILGVLSESFKTHPIVISEVDTGKYIIEDNGYHRYTILRLHYLNEYIKVKDNPLLVAELNEKYKVPVKVYKLDTIKTYSISLLKELGTDIKVKTSSVTKKSKIFIDGKKVNMTDSELIEFTKNKINSNRNATQIINKLLRESESFREFYIGYLSNESSDYGIELDTEETTTNRQIEVNNKTYSIDTIIEILNSKYLEILRGRTIDGINMQNIFTIVNKVFENNPEIKNKYNKDYDNIVDIFKTKYVHKNGNLYPKTFNFIKTEDIINILKNPYKLQRYSKEKRIQINKAINMYVDYAISNNYDITPKEYKGYTKVSDLMSRDIPNIKLTSEVKSPLLNEFRRNVLSGGTFGSKQNIIKLLLERKEITNAINYLFNIDAQSTKFLEQIQGFTDEEFIDLLDTVVDESGGLKGLYWLTQQFELFDLMQENLGNIGDLEIIKFLYLFESTECGGRGICNYLVAVNMIFNKYLGKEAEFKRDFGYSMYVVTKDGKKRLNDMMLLVDMYSIINKEVFTKEKDDMVKVTVTSNQDYLPVTKTGGSFDIQNIQKFLDKKGIKLDLNQTFRFDSRFDLMWKDEILSNVKKALEKGETVNLSADGFNLYRADGKTLIAEDFGAHAMTVVGITKDGNLIVDSHGMEMVVNLDLCLEQAGKVYKDKTGKIQTRRIGISTYSFDSSIPSSNQNKKIVDVSETSVNKEIDEGIFDVFSKPSGDIDLLKDALSNNQLNTLNELEIDSLIENINKGKIKPKDYDLTSETICILIDKVPLKKIFPISNVTAIKSFIDYFGVDTLVKFDKLNNGFLFGNNGENIYGLYDFYDLTIPKTNDSDRLKELNDLIVKTINSNKKTEYKTYTFNYSELIGSEFAKMHSELFLDESAPQDLKEVFYNGLVNSGNEYKSEWSKYLEGKSVKGVIHKPLIGVEDVKVVENINALGENSSKYHEGLEVLAKRVGLSIEEVQEILSSKLKDLIETSEFGVRRTLKSLQSVLETRKLKNQFEVNHSSYGVSNTDMRMDMEESLFGIPRNIKYEDRPIYGMLLPQDLSSKYVHKGPGAYYSDGSGVIYIFDKSKIINNATLTLGDSIDQAGKICATSLSNPRYFGMFNEMLSTIKTKEDLLNFSFTNLYEKTVMEVGNSAYYEFQLHGKDSHSLDNLKEIIFLKMPEAKIIERLKELNISYRVIG